MLRVLVVSEEGFHGERLVFIEALDAFGVGLDELFGQRGVGGDDALLHDVSGGGEDIVVVGEVGESLVAGFLDLEVSGGGEERGIGASALESGGASADVGADGNPFDVA